MQMPCLYKRVTSLKTLTLSLLLFSGFNTAVTAQEAKPEVLNCDNAIGWKQPDNETQSGSQEFSGYCTNSLLEMQRSGDKSSDYQQKLPAVVLDEILERYENSFTHPVPEYFVSTEFTSSE